MYFLWRPLHKACWFSFLDYLLSFSGDVARVDGQLAVARAFGDKSLKRHLSSEPDITVEIIDEDTEFAILASDGIWKVSLISSFEHISARLAFNLKSVFLCNDKTFQLGKNAGNVESRCCRLY